MKRITITGSNSKDRKQIVPPDTIEVHVTNRVAKVLGLIVGIGDDFNDGWYSPKNMLTRLNQNMEPFKPLMLSAGLRDADFFDMVVTLRAMVQYASDLNEYLAINHFSNPKEFAENDPGDDPDPYAGCYQGA